MGVYCFAPRVLAHIEPDVRLDFPDLILRLLDAGERVEAWRPDAYWLDLGRHDDYEQAIASSRRCAQPAAARISPDASASRTAAATASTLSSSWCEESGSARWRSAAASAVRQRSGRGERRELGQRCSAG